jgi:chromosome segregation protein
VAIALVMAFLRVRPTAFCVLDEIEAALDEANVVRCADYLREVAEGLQVIVVTHQKGTMEVADRLIGVTMAEAGVSRLLSVRLAG